MPVLALDIGGTKIAAALVSDEGTVIAREYRLALAHEGPRAVMERVFAAIDQVLNLGSTGLNQIHSISIAAAGAIDSAKGLVTSSPNLPGWRNVPLREMVEEEYGVFTVLLNDANAAALGEHRFGAGKGAKNLIYLTVSTGIGGGIIINGELYTGQRGSAGEIGHMTIDAHGPRCNCGNTGCLEMLASGSAIAREARMRLKNGEMSSLLEMVRDIEDITSEKVGMAAQNGDALALEVITQAATYLGIGLVNVVNIFNPEIIVVGGGVAKLGELLLNPARGVVKERAIPLFAETVRIVPAQLGTDSGMVGAAVFARQQRRLREGVGDEGS